jgi:HEAT repeat protein
MRVSVIGPSYFGFVSDFDIRISSFNSVSTPRTEKAMNIRYPIALFAVIILLAGVADPLRGDSPSAEDKLLDVLKSAAAVGDKANACRELKLAGTEKSVPVLASLLTDAELSHPARYALESMAYPAAGAALRDALGKATGLARSGIIDSLGQRRDPLAVRLLAADLASKDIVLVSAAATALGKIGTSEAATVLTAARTDAKAPARIKIDDGLVLCADRLRVAGKAEEAAKICAELSQPGEPRLVRAGALRGRMQAAGSASVIAESLADADAMVRSAAAAELRNLSDADLGAIAADMAKLPPTAQTAVLAAIRIRGRSVLAPAAIAATKSPHEMVRLAAARALGTVGDLTALPALAELAAAEGPVGQTAQQSLEAIYGPKIDEQIFAALRAEKDPIRRAAWIGVLQAHRPAGVVALLIGEAGEQGPVVATRAWAALAKLAAPNDIPALVAALLKTEKGPVREEAERAVRQVCLQIADATQRAQAVLKIYEAAAPADRLALLPLLGRIGGSDVRAVVQAALDSKDPAVYEAGVRAISNWPDATAADQLLRLAETAEAPVHREWALRAFVRVVSLPGGATNAAKLAQLKQAMQLSKTGEQQAWVIQRASAVRAVESLRFVAPYLDQPALAEHACLAVVDLAHHKEVRDPNRKEFAAALQKVLATAKDSIVLERAKRYLEAQ